MIWMLLSKKSFFTKLAIFGGACSCLFYLFIAFVTFIAIITIITILKNKIPGLGA